MDLPTLHLVLKRELAAVRREIEAYPDDDSVWRMVPGTPNTGGTLALHLAGNLQHYFGAVLGKSRYVRDRDAEFAQRNVPRSELLRGLDAAGAALDATFRTLKPTDLAAPYPEVVAKRRVNTGVFLLHLATHLSYHLGQIDYHRRAATRDTRGVGAVAVQELPEVV